MAKKQKPPWEKKSSREPLDLESEVTAITAIPASLSEELEGGQDDRLFHNAPSFFERYQRWIFPSAILLLVIGGVIFWPRAKPKSSASVPVAVGEFVGALRTKVAPSVLPTVAPQNFEPITKPGPTIPLRPRAAPAVKPAPRTAARVARPKVKVVALPAKLNVEAQPWAMVYINDKRLNRITPIRGLELPEGRHRLRLENPQTKKRIEQDIRLKAGQVLTLKFQMR